MSVIFQCISELQPGPKWQDLFERLWPTYHRWFLKQGDHARPKFLSCEAALKQHMPELLPLYSQLVELAGGSDAVARFLSLYCPTPYLSGCSQAVWTRDESFLIRNYDYDSKLWEGLLLRTCWNGKQVMAMSDCLWGVLDGMNEDGLAVSLAFGGRKSLGVGFGIPLILRYILEFCDTTAQATEVLGRIPSHMAYNVTVLDRAGTHATVFVSPDKDIVVSRRKLATNHQDTVDWPEHARATASLDRAHVLSLRLQDPHETHERFVTRFLEPPLYQHNHQHGWGTLYTTTYNPSRGVLTCRWPGYCLERTLENFPEQAVALNFG
ncbi:MAG: hypothetical protein IT422_02400 [Pirellulaceae bacterium]|nr:hypothetical protein [Pirellulaceae bacterium]